jgi:RNA polymerase sigma-70 factor (ECF subfamily)
MNTEEFSALYREHLPALSKYLVRRVPVDVVEDLASDIIEIAWRKRKQAPEGKELAWLYKIAGYVVANYRTKTNNRTRILNLLLEPQSAPSAEAIALGDHDLSIAWAALKDSERNLISLSSFEELSVNEIAVTLNISNNAVSIRLHRAKTRLQDLLDDLKGEINERN